MNRRTAIQRLAILFLTTASLAQAQQPKKVPPDRLSKSRRSSSSRLPPVPRQFVRLCAASPRRRDGTSPPNTDMRRGSAIGSPSFQAELVRLKVEIIVVARGAGPIQAAMKATKTIPIVMVGGGLDPVEAGLVESLARPGGNVTGLTNLTENLDGTSWRC